MSVETPQTHAKGWYHGWNIVVVAILSQTMANGLPINAFSLFLRDWSRDLQTPISKLQLGLASLGLISALLSPFTGALADKRPARLIFGAGLAALALFHIGISYVSVAWQFIALYALVLPISLSLSAAITANAVLSRWFVRRLGLALGLSAFGLGMAGVVLPPIIAALAPAFGWRTIWRFAGVLIALVIAPLVVWVVRDRPGERDGLYYLTRDPSASTPNIHGRASNDGLSWRDVLKRRNFWLLVVTYLPMLGLYGGVAQNLAPIAATRGFSGQTAGILLSAFSLSYVASSLTMGLLSDRVGNRLPLFGLTIACGIGGLIVAAGHGLIPLTGGVMLVGLSGGMWPLLAAAVAVEFGSGGVGRAFGLLTFFVPIISLAPFTVARLQESTGSYAAGLSALAAVTFLGGCACLFIRERQRIAQEASA